MTPSAHPERGLLWVLASATGGFLAYALALVLILLIEETIGLNTRVPFGFAAFHFLFGGIFGLAVATPQALLLDTTWRAPRRRWIAFTALGFAIGFFVANSLDLILTGAEDSLHSFAAGIMVGLFVGLAQWFALGPHIQRPVTWASISGGAWAIAIGISGLGSASARLTDPISFQTSAPGPAGGAAVFFYWSVRVARCVCCGRRGARIRSRDRVSVCAPDRRKPLRLR